MDTPLNVPTGLPVDSPERLLGCIDIGEKEYTVSWVGRLPTTSINDAVMDRFRLTPEEQGLRHVAVFVGDGEMGLIAQTTGHLLSATSPAVLSGILHAIARAGLSTFYVSKSFSMELIEEE